MPVVLGPLAALHEGVVAAGDAPTDLSRRRAEGRRAFAGVEHAEATGGPGAAEVAPPAPTEGPHQGVDSAGQPAAHRLYRPGHGRVLRVQEVDDLERRRDVDALGAGVALLGEPRVAVVGNSHEGYRMAPKLDVDPNSGQRAQFGMRRFSVLGLLVLMACGSGIKLPETIPVTPDVPAPFPPAEAPPETPARPGAEEQAARPALIAADWPLGQRVRPV